MVEEQRRRPAEEAAAEAVAAAATQPRQPDRKPYDMRTVSPVGLGTREPLATLHSANCGAGASTKCPQKQCAPQQACQRDGVQQRSPARRQLRALLTAARLCACRHMTCRCPLPLMSFLHVTLALSMMLPST